MLRTGAISSGLRVGGAFGGEKGAGSVSPVARAERNRRAPRRTGALVAALAVVVVAAGAGVFLATRDEDRATPGPDTSATTIASPPDTGGQAAGARPLGTVAAAQAPARGCATGATCAAFTVTCPDVPDTTAIVATGEAAGAPKGVIVFFSGGGGDMFWDEASPDSEVFLADLQSDGYVVVQVRWDPSWSNVNPGQSAGWGAVACRSATMVKQVYDQQYVPLGVAPATGACGFCVTGVSGGASQTGYSLAFYGLAPIIDAAVLASGPPHADIEKGCITGAGDEGFAYDLQQQKDFDAVYGDRANGPCQRRDESQVQQWEADSVETGGAFYSYDTTRVVFIFGGKDRTPGPAHGRTYVQKLQDSGSPMVDVVEVPNMAHYIERSPDGLAALGEALRASA